MNLELLIYLYFPLAYVLGSVQFSLLFNKITRQKKTRKITTAIPGQTRIHFLVEPWFLLAAYLLDFSKAWLATYLALRIFDSPLAGIVAGVLVVLGDSYSLFRRFQGSRGILCTIGALAAFDPRLLLLLGFFYLVIIVFFPYRYLAFVLLMAGLPLALAVFKFPTQIIVFSLLSLIIITVRHIPNIKNFFEGQEPNLQEEFSYRPRS